MTIQIKRLSLLFQSIFLTFALISLSNDCFAMQKKRQLIVPPPIRTNPVQPPQAANNHAQPPVVEQEQPSPQVIDQSERVFELQKTKDELLLKKKQLLAKVAGQTLSKPEKAHIFEEIYLINQEIKLIDEEFERQKGSRFQVLVNKLRTIVRDKPLATAAVISVLTAAAIVAHQTQAKRNEEARNEVEKQALREQRETLQKQLSQEQMRADKLSQEAQAELARRQARKNAKLKRQQENKEQDERTRKANEERQKKIDEKVAEFKKKYEKNTELLTLFEEITKYSKVIGERYFNHPGGSPKEISDVIGLNLDAFEELATSPGKMKEVAAKLAKLKEIEEKVRPELLNKINRLAKLRSYFPEKLKKSVEECVNQPELVPTEVLETLPSQMTDFVKKFAGEMRDSFIDMKKEYEDLVKATEYVEKKLKDSLSDKEQGELVKVKNKLATIPALITKVPELDITEWSNFASYVQAVQAVKQRLNEFTTLEVFSKIKKVSLKILGVEFFTYIGKILEDDKKKKYKEKISAAIIKQFENFKQGLESALDTAKFLKDREDEDLLKDPIKHFESLNKTINKAVKNYLKLRSEVFK